MCASGAYGQSCVSPVTVDFIKLHKNLFHHNFTVLAKSRGFKYQVSKGGFGIFTLF